MRAIVWMGLCAVDYTPPRIQILLCGDGELLEGLGAMQSKAELKESTIGALRDEFGDDDIANSLPADRKAWVWEDTEARGGEGLTLILAEVS